MRRRYPSADHRQRADDMRRHPYTWIQVGIYNGPSSAKGVARQIRNGGTIPHYLPAGTFETRTRPTPDGGTALYARYIGETK